MPRLTDTRIRNLKPSPRRYIEWDSNGLGIRVGTSGKKSFVYAYREGSRVRWMTLGAYPGITLAEAREKHGIALAAHKKGLSPANVKLKVKRESREAITVAELVDYYIERHAKRQKRSWREDERMLHKDVVPRIEYLKAREVRRRKIIDLIEQITNRGSPVIANRTLEVVTKMFNFAVERELLEATPAAGIKRLHKEQSRDRTLSEDEIRDFWTNLPETQMTEGVRLALQVILATGQRRAEVAEASWDEFDFSTDWWTIPATRAKNGLSHRVPLSPFSLELLDKVKTLSGDSPFLFPSPQGNRPIRAGALTRAINRNIRTFKVPDISPHDLRRTVASNMARLGVPRLVLSKILNHVDSSVTAVYDRHSYDDKKRQAFDAWATKLDQILGEDEAHSSLTN